MNFEYLKSQGLNNFLNELQSMVVYKGTKEIDLAIDLAHFGRFTNDQSGRHFGHFRIQLGIL